MADRSNSEQAEPVTTLTFDRDGDLLVNGEVLVTRKDGLLNYSTHWSTGDYLPYLKLDFWHETEPTVIEAVVERLKGSYDVAWFLHYPAAPFPF